MSATTTHAPSRAGRNVPMAIAVGVALGALVLVSLYAYRPLFVVVVGLAVAYGCYELAVVLRDAAGRIVPLLPLVVGTGVTFGLAYNRGTQALAVGVMLTGIALLAWRLVEGGAGADIAKDLAAGMWVLCYLVLLAGFAILLAAPDDGARRATCYIATVVCSDVGGFAAGVFFGKHPLAPAVSPKKSWEGLVGSIGVCVLGGGLMVGLMLHEDWWKGVLFGVVVAVAATAGDLGESLIKRDLGVKDMGRLLPGHGGIMDRLDSMLFVAPVAYLLLSSLAS